MTFLGVELPKFINVSCCRPELPVPRLFVIAASHTVRLGIRCVPRTSGVLSDETKGNSSSMTLSTQYYVYCYHYLQIIALLSHLSISFPFEIDF